MKCDIFISYRREGGYDTAKHLYDLLKNDGYSVSFDIDTLRSGNFDVQLYKRIESCKDFILILDKNVFIRSIDSRTSREHDWVRCELAHALKNGLNIIPIFLDGFKEFPVNLPDDIKEISKKNGLRYNRDYFDAFYSNIKTRFLKSKPKRFYLKRVLAVLGALAVIAGVGQFVIANISDNNIEEDKFFVMSNSADSLVKVSGDLLDESGESLKSEFIEKLQQSVLLYDNSLRCNITDSSSYKSVLVRKAAVMEILDSCRAFNDLSEHYKMLMMERSVVAAAQCNEKRKNTLQNIRKLLNSL